MVNNDVGIAVVEQVDRRQTEEANRRSTHERRQK
jgi:hypothetical protein